MRKASLALLLVALAGCGNKPKVVEERPGESIEDVFARCGVYGPCTVIWHNESIDGPVYYKQRCDKDRNPTTNGVGKPCIYIPNTGEVKPQ